MPVPFGSLLEPDVAKGAPAEIPPAAAAAAVGRALVVGVVG